MMMMITEEYRRIGNIRRLFKNDYYKLIKTDDGFASRTNNYIEYTSRGDRYKSLSPKEYLDMIRQYLRDLIDEHKPTTELNNNDEHGEWKNQLVMRNNCITTKHFEDTRTMYSASKYVEFFMGSGTNDTIDTLFDTLLQRFQQVIETSNNNGSGFTHENVALLYYYFMKIRRTESYVKSPDWIPNKGTTINSKNEKDNECFQLSTTSALNYNKILKKYLKKIAKLKRVDIGPLSHQKNWEEFEQSNTLIVLNVLFVSYNSEEIKLAYKSRYNSKRENYVILLMINDEAKKY